MNFFILAAAATIEAAKKAPSVAPSGTQEAIDNALWQYPVAALVIFVILIFLRDRKKAEERNHQFLTDTNKLDREDREQAQKRFTASLVAVQDRSDNTSRVMVDTFTKSTAEATSTQSSLLARSIDTIDRNTEAFGEVKAMLRAATGTYPAMRDPEDYEEEVEVVKPKPKPRKRKPRKRVVAPRVVKKTDA